MENNQDVINVHIIDLSGDNESKIVDGAVEYTITTNIEDNTVKKASSNPKMIEIKTVRTTTHEIAIKQHLTSGKSFVQYFRYKDVNVHIKKNKINNITYIILTPKDKEYVM